MILAAVTLDILTRLFLINQLELMYLVVVAVVTRLPCSEVMHFFVPCRTTFPTQTTITGTFGEKSNSWH